MLQCPRTSARTSSVVAWSGGQGGQAVDGLVLDLAGFADVALTLDAEGHLAVGHSDLVVVGGEVEHPAASLLEPPVSLV